MREAIQAALVDGKLPCAGAFAVAVRIGSTPLDVGQEADAMGVRIARCQLGLFGYGDKQAGKHRIIRPLDAVPPKLEAALTAVAREGRVGCEDLWRISAELGIPKLTVSGGAETLKLKVKRCQLGCF